MCLINKTDPPACLIGLHLNGSLQVPYLVNHYAGFVLQSPDPKNIRVVPAYKLPAWFAGITGLIILISA
jgi:hypothetical protein